MLDELTPEQFDELVELYELEPFGPLVEARQRAMAISVAIAAAGQTQSADEILREWGFDVIEPELDPVANEAAVKAAFGC